MKIELDLPDWVDTKHIYVMAGIELVAYKHWKKPWKIKTSRCNMCGKCCESFPKNASKVPYPPNINGVCVYLKKDGDKKYCSLGINRPFKCCVVPSPKGIPECTEVLKKYENKVL